MQTVNSFIDELLRLCNVRDKWRVTEQGHIHVNVYQEADDSYIGKEFTKTELDLVHQDLYPALLGLYDWFKSATQLDVIPGNRVEDTIELYIGVTREFTRDTPGASTVLISHSDELEIHWDENNNVIGVWLKGIVHNTDTCDYEDREVTFVRNSEVRDVPLSVPALNTTYPGWLTKWRACQALDISVSETIKTIFSQNPSVEAPPVMHDINFE